MLTPESSRFVTSQTEVKQLIDKETKYDQSSLGKYGQAAATVDSPIGQAAVATLGGATPLERIKRLAECYSYRPPLSGTAQDILGYVPRTEELFFPGSRTGRLAEVYTENEIVVPHSVETEDDLPKRHEENTLERIMSRHDSTLPLMRILFALEPDVRDTTWSELSKMLGRNAYDARLLAQKMIVSGILTPEEYAVALPSIAPQLLSTIIYDTSYGTSRLGGISFISALRGDFDRFGSSRTPARIFEIGAKGGRDIEPGPEYEVDIAAKLDQFVPIATALMARAGWVQPESYYKTALEFIQASQASRTPVHEERARRITRDGQIRTMVEKFLNATIPGKVLLHIEELALVSAAEQRFQAHLLREGVPLTQPILNDTGAVTLRQAYPEHLFLEEYYKRHYKFAEMQRHLDSDALKGAHQGTLSYTFIEAGIADYERNGVDGELTSQLQPIRDALVALGMPIHGDDLRAMMKDVFGYLHQYFDTPLIQEYNPEDRQRLELFHHYMQSFKAFRATNRGGYSLGSLSYVEAFVEELLHREAAVKPIDVTLSPGTPMALLGENGGGKSTILATILQQRKAPVYALAQATEVPGMSVPILATGDRVELEGKRRVMWGRQSGQSSFVMEVTGSIERMQRYLSSDRPIVGIGDEIGRRTDQLNGMALVGTELLTAATKGHSALVTSHYNSMNRVFGPLFDRVGVSIDWRTMHQFSPQPIDTDTTIESKAYRQAQRFLPKEIGTAWAEQRQEAPAEEYGSEYINRRYTAIQEDRLQQLGWLKVDRNNRDTPYQLTGLASYLLGSSRLSPQKNEMLGKVDQYNGTVLNPRWEHNSNLKDWIRRIQANPEATAPTISGLTEIYKLQNKILNFMESSFGERRLEISRQLFQAVQALQLQIPGIRQQLLGISETLPGIELSDLVDQLATLETVGSVEGFQLLTSGTQQAEHLSTIFCLAQNLAAANAVDVQPSTTPGLHFKDIASYDLRKRAGSDHPVVENSLSLENTVLFTGPQGSGKTEALFSLSEATMMASLWDKAIAREAMVGGNWEVGAFITLPEFADRASQDSISSLQREARDRIGVIAQWLSELPDGVRPIVYIDELLSSTNTGDAAEGIVALEKLIREKQGILVLATHSHESVYTMEDQGTPFTAKYVGLFDTENAFQWLDGHGESMGIEVAEKLGMDPRAVAIAKLLRSYLTETKFMTPEPSTLEEYSKKLSSLLTLV